jgi:Fe(3+) dicitrate transport protein
MKMPQSILFTLLLFCFQFSWAQNYSIHGAVQAEEGRLSEAVEVFLQEKNLFLKAEADGSFRFDSLLTGKYTLTIFAKGYQSIVEEHQLLDEDLHLTFRLKRLQGALNTVAIEEKKANDFGIDRLKPVEGTAIYAGKKSEVINMEDIAANLATNNARQVFNKVAGLNIWESDGAGIQLGIGGRGLNPNRVSNFNTRQNGYDISADALGYPESYYSPPTEALERIEVVRGAASLQYGTQFGGFLNFKLKSAPKEKTLELLSRQTLGSFGLFNSFNSVGGNKGKWSYYTYLQYKRGDGWRPNSEFNVYNAHLNLAYAASASLQIGFEYTFMHYLAKQAGGLTDALYTSDPRQSIRDRNWFRVNWNLLALTLDYQLSDRSEINWRTFGLLAGRDAVGVLDQITRMDNPDLPRDLLSDDYRNIGTELRLLHRYSLLSNTSVFLIGTRYYNGFTARNQGNGSISNEADFKYAEPGLPEDSKYDFPSQNLAFFTENIFYLSPSFSVTPGLRFEYISTNAEGYYFDRFIANNGDTLRNDQRFEQRSNDRSFLLAGIGLSYKPTEKLELYANFSQNYRSINFNDMRIDNPNYQVDPNLKDEKGFSADLGLRGNKQNFYNYDISLFLLHYNDRIGTTLEKDPVLFRPYRFRTNISDSRSLGIESFVEVNLLALIGREKQESSLSVFSNLSLINAKYIGSDEEAFDGNEVELVPDLIFKGGITYRKEHFQVSYQYSYTSEHFSDATNADFSSNAVVGLIPVYEIMDLSAKYAYKKWIVEAGINNLMDEIYFTRRASGYPGPGIIPSDPRTYYFTLGVKL